MKKSTLLEELYDNKPGPPPEPVMWRAIYRPENEYCTIECTIGPCQTWFQARELARTELAQLLGRPVSEYDIHIQALQ